MANFIFVKSNFAEGKKLGYYEGIELKYGENAFSTLEDALNYYNSDAVTDKDSWNDNIFVLDKNVDASNILPAMVRIKPYYDADKHTDNVYNAKNTLNFKDVDFTAQFSTMRFDNFLNLNVENSTVTAYVLFSGGSSNEINGYKYVSQGTAKITNSDVGYLENYLNVNVANSLVRGSIDGGTQIRVQDDSNYVGNKEEKSQSGERIFINTDKMLGKAVVKDSEITGSFNYFKTVNAENSSFREICSSVDAVETLTWTYTTNGDTITRVDDSVTKGSVTGSFSGKNIKVNETGVSGDPGILGFKTVKLVNSYVNGYIGYMNFYDWASYYRTVNERKYAYGKEYDVGSIRTALEYEVKATGSFTASIDKNASIENEYKLGTIQGYKTVTIKGLNDIRYSTYQIDGYDVYGQFNGLEQVVWNRVSVGTVKISDTDIGGSVAGFKTVTVTDSDMPIDSYFSGGSDEQANNSAVRIRNAFGKFTAQITDGKDHTIGRVNYFENVNISGYSKKGVNATLTVSRISGGNYYIKEGSNNSTVKGTLKVKNNVEVQSYDNISIRFFKNVILENNVRVAKGIQGGNYYDGVYSCGNGTLTLKNNVYVAGGVWNFKTVNMTDSHIDDRILGNDGVKSVLNMSSSSLRAGIATFNKVNIKKGVNSVKAYLGTSQDDVFTIAANATLKVSGGTEYTFDFGDGNDKLVVNGTLVLKDAKIQNLEAVSGKGTVACVENMYEAVTAALPEKYTVEVLNLGNTVDNFVSKKYEAGDDTEKKAYKWDMSKSYDGWMAGEGACDFADTVDFVKFNADEAVSLEFSGGADNNFKLILNGNEISADNFKDFACTEGSNILEIRREIGSSTTYSLSVVENV